MYRLTSDTTERFCSRCRKELTDPASREVGVGPQCRNKDNRLYAKTIEASLPIAGALVLGTHVEELPNELSERFLKFKTSFLHKMEKVQKSNDALAMKIAGADFREEVRELDYFLSYMMAEKLRDRLIKIVESLGYIGLAGVLSGDASKSPAKVWLENGRIWLSGTSSTAGFLEMKKISGVQVPRFRGDKSPYSAPISQWQLFVANIRKFWPLYESNLEMIAEQAQKLQPLCAPIRQEQNILSKPEEVARISFRTDDFLLSFPWRKKIDMYPLINGLKEVPLADRRYDPEIKCWSFKIEYLAHVRRHLSKIFEVVDEVKTKDLTPAGLYTQSKSRPNARRRPRHRY